MSEVELDEELFSVCIPFRPEFVGSFLHFTTRNLVIVCVCVCVCVRACVCVCVCVCVCMVEYM